MKRALLLVLPALLALTAAPARAQGVGVDTPMDFKKQFSGDQGLRFEAGGWSVRPKGAKLNYRVITTKAEWKQTWGYLYDASLDVDFKKYRVLAVYKSPARGGYRFIPKRVYNLEGKMSMAIETVWDGKETRGHPFLFLVVEPFKGLEVEETFLGPPGKPVRYP